MNKAIFKALNDQINREFFSAYQYRAMSSFFESLGYKGFANWMAHQAQEEMMHFQKMVNYIHLIDGDVVLQAVDKPKQSWKSPIDVFEDSLKQERMITKHIHQLVDLSIQYNDHSTRHFLQWFVDEQVEEEDSVQSILKRFELSGNHPASLLMMDQELGKRASA